MLLGAAQIWSSIPGDRGTCDLDCFSRIPMTSIDGILSSRPVTYTLLPSNSGHVVKDEAKQLGQTSRHARVDVYTRWSFRELSSHYCLLRTRISYMIFLPISPRAGGDCGGCTHDSPQAVSSRLRADGYR